jgi:hypothetical protein
MMILVVGLLLLSVLGGQGLGQSLTGRKSHQRLDTKSLSEVLRRMEMITLLEALAEETNDDALILKAKQILIRTATPDQRAKLHEEIVELIKKKIEKLDKILQTAEEGSDKQEEALVAKYQTQMQYIEQMLVQCQPHFSKMAFMLAGPEDSKALLEITAESLKIFSKIDKALKREIADARIDPMKTVSILPELEDAQKWLWYRGAYLQFYRGISMPKRIDGKENEERLDLLEKAAKEADRAANDADMGVKPYAELLRGRCMRELDRYSDANKSLKWAVGKKSIAAVKTESLFETVRNDLEWGASLIRSKDFKGGEKQFNAAGKSLANFEKQLKGKHPPLGLDVKKVLLGYELYDQWAAALRSVKKEKEADAKEKQAQKVFLSLLTKYRGREGILSAFVEMLKERFTGKDIDLKEIDPVIVLLLANLELAEGQRLQKDGNAAADSKLQEARRMFDIVLQSKADSAKDARPGALWGKGVAELKLRNNFEAAALFRQLVNEFPKDGNAFPAAKGAVQINNLLIADFQRNHPGKPVPTKRRKELIDSLLVMLKLFGDKPEAAVYNFDLAWQYEKLAEIAGTDEELKGLLTKAEKRYGMVPAGSPLHTEATYYKLEINYRLLEMMEKSSRKQDLARNLKNDMLSYGGKVYSKWQAKAPNDTTEPTKTQVGLWGSTSEFHGQVISYEILGMRDAALIAITKLRDRWPGTKVLRDSGEFLIRKLLESDRVDQALKEFNGYRRKYGEKEAQKLMLTIVETLRKTIKKLQAAGKTGPRLESFRKAYLDFAKQVYDTKGAEASDEGKYALTTMYADALVMQGDKKHATEALPLLKTLDEIDTRRREVLKNKIDEYINARRKEVARDRNRISTVKILNKDLLDALKHFGMEDWRSSQIADVKYAMGQLDKGEGEPQARATEAAAAIDKAYQAMRKVQVESLNIDAIVVMMRARAYMILEKYEDAISLYRNLAAGLDPVGMLDMYWESQVDFAQCLLQANRDKPRELALLIIRINQLKINNPNAIPKRFQGQLNRIAAEAKERIEDANAAAKSTKAESTKAKKEEK